MDLERSEQARGDIGVAAGKSLDRCRRFGLDDEKAAAFRASAERGGPDCSTRNKGAPSSKCFLWRAFVPARSSDMPGLSRAITAKNIVTPP
jgi:hypothetical protein